MNFEFLVRKTGGNEIDKLRKHKIFIQQCPEKIDQTKEANANQIQVRCLVPWVVIRKIVISLVITRSSSTKKQRSDGGTVLAWVVIRETCMYFSLPKMDTRAEFEVEKSRPSRRPEKWGNSIDIKKFYWIQQSWGKPDPMNHFAQWHFCSKFHPNLFKSSHGNVWGVEISRKDQGTGICCQIALFFSQNWINFVKLPRNGVFLMLFDQFWTFLKIFQFWLKNSGWNLKIRVPWSFLLLLTPILTPGARY